MELALGYRETEIRILPEDWNAIPLGELTSRISRGASPRPIQSPRWFDSQSLIGWVRISDVTRSGRYLLETTQKLSKAGIENSRYVPSGSLIMSICATVGRPIETRIDVCIHDGFVVFEQPTIDQSYLYHVLKAQEPKWSTTGQTGSQMNLNTGIIGITKVPVPPSGKEQQAIATALDDIDELLVSLTLHIAKKRDLKQATMQQLLAGKTRLPGFDKEWCTINLASSSVLKARIGWQGLTTHEYETTGEFRLVTGTDFNNGTVDWDNCFYVSKLRYEQDRYIQLKIGDVLITKDGTIGKVGFVNSLPLPATLNSGVFVIRPKADAYIPRFLYYVLKSRVFDRFIAMLQAGSTINHLYQKDFVGFSFDAPPLEEQEAIASVLSDMDAELTMLEAKRDKTVALKQGMMQELLTGRTRLI